MTVNLIAQQSRVYWNGIISITGLNIKKKNCTLISNNITSMDIRMTRKRKIFSELLIRVGAPYISENCKFINMCIYERVYTLRMSYGQRHF